MSGRSGLEIRRAGEDDATGLAQLLEAAGCVVSPASLSRRIAAITTGTGTVLIAQEWGPPSGVISTHWFRHLGGDHPSARIDLLLVAPDARRRGLGRLLVKAVAQAARIAGCREIALEATVTSNGLDAFARDTGFAVRGTTLTRNLRRER